MQFIPLIVAALALGACAGDPAITTYQASRLSPDCGLAARTLRPMVVTIAFVEAEQMPDAARGASLPRANAVHGFIRTTTVGNLRTHRITAPLPTAEADPYAWRVLFHELRHANGEAHDTRGCWLPGDLPASPNHSVAALHDAEAVN
jgi:hypothetical protein